MGPVSQVLINAMGPETRELFINEVEPQLVLLYSQGQLEEPPTIYEVPEQSLDRLRRSFTRAGTFIVISASAAPTKSNNTTLNARLN